MPHSVHALGSANAFQSAVDWFAGNGAYHNLIHCMGQDYLWIAITVALDVAVAAGYLLIAKHWWKNERLLPRDLPARKALGSMRNIFLFCGICGYLFIPIKMVWPAWRLYDIFMVVLVYSTWRYAWRATDLKVIYSELGRTTRLTEELEASREESQRKTFFLNAISHDLRTPLNGLMLQASLAEVSADSGDQDGLRKAVSDMKASARVTGDLLDSLLEFARLDLAADQNQPSQFALGELIQEVCKMHRQSAESAGLTLRIQCPPDLQVKSDRKKLERSLSNLVGNAVKFTKSGSVRVDVAHDGQSAEIHVIDTGVGIRPEDQGRLFQEFFQVHNHERDRRKGFGLGLAIARRLIQQLGGDISVTSAVGQGSRFTVALPGAVCRSTNGQSIVRPAAETVPVSAG